MTLGDLPNCMVPRFPHLESGDDHRIDLTDDEEDETSSFRDSTCPSGDRCPGPTTPVCAVHKRWFRVEGAVTTPPQSLVSRVLHL